MPSGQPAEIIERGLDFDEDARPSIVLAEAPDWITAELVEATIRVWQPYYEATLTPEEAVIMILNVGRLFDALSSGA